MNDELKPCPFCGGECEIERMGTNRVSMQYRCTECGCSLETGETVGSGIGCMWNNRAEISPVEGKQLVSEEAIKYLHDQWPEAYKVFYDKL